MCKQEKLRKSRVKWGAVFLERCTRTGHPPTRRKRLDSPEVLREKGQNKTSNCEGQYEGFNSRYSIRDTGGEDRCRQGRKEEELRHLPVRLDYL